jgi:hypothetical protein
MVLTLISNHCFKLTISVGMPNYCFTLHQYIWHCGTNANSCVGVRGSIALHLWECEGNFLYTYYLWECVTFALHLLSVGMCGNYLFTLIVLPAMGMRDHITLQLLSVGMSDYCFTLI